MLDLDAIEARAREALLRVGDCDLDTLNEGTAGDVEEIQELANDIPALVAELRAAREVVEAAQANADTWNEHYHQRPVDRNLVTALAAFRAVVGEA